MKKREGKTPDYTLRAIAKYNERFDIVTVKLPRGAKERMQGVGMTPADRVRAIMDELERRENESK